MNKKTLLKLSVCLGFTFALALILWFLSSIKAYQILELKTLDLRFALRAKAKAASPVIHIDIDDESLNKLGRWPWPRSYHARLVDTLTECGAKQVLFDVLFTEQLKDNPQDDLLFSEAIKRSKNTYLPFYFSEEKNTPAEELTELLSKDISLSNEEVSERLALDIDSVKEALPTAKKYVIDKTAKSILHENPGISVEELLSKIEETKEWFLFAVEESYIRENFDNYRSAEEFYRKFSLPQDADYLIEYKKINVPISKYQEVIRGSGYINAETDEDGVMRKVAVFSKYSGRIFPQLAVAGLLDVLSVEKIGFLPGHIIFKNAVIEGRRQDIDIPVDKNGRILINWAGKWGESFKHAPYYYILRLQETRQRLTEQLNSGQDPQVIEYLKDAEAQLKNELKKLVDGKICFIGLTGTGTQDMGPIPLQKDYPYVGVSSNLINTIITRRFISRSPPALDLSIFFLTALILGLCSTIKLWKSMLISAAYAFGYFLAAFLLFEKAGLWVDVVGPEAIVVFGFSAITSFRYFTEEKEKLWIKQAFSRYLSKEVINELMNDPSKLKLGGERKNITVIFSDVRGFTKFSESRQPEEIVAMLNEILTQQAQVVFNYNGTLDKFVGDELMAFFGAPGEIHAKDHAFFAVRTALEMQAKVAELREHWKKESKELLEIGIGVNSGDMVVGNMGSAEMMDYTVIGDNVNLAARLCSAAGASQIIISEATYEKIKDKIDTERLEPISVKGKAKPISIYRVLKLKEGIT
ncbi:MAG: adenylate/guanylate cyclase domain-containing protein [Candidatus Omnitrophica bacterium]|nr:adenylate/guanylate cyclase domain-containing protein [Candidatus Omnitrophota bacterium]